MITKQAINEKFDECKRFICFVAIHFIEDDCTYRASALAFATLLAIVPLMSVALTILSTFPVFHHLASPVQDFIFANFVPATGKYIQGYLQIFASQVSKLSISGVVFLFITALLVMYTIESAMNKIWRISSSRQGISAFLLYWAIISLAPFLLGLSFAFSTYFFSIPFIAEHQVPAFLGTIVPFIFSLASFTFLYVVVPNCPVQFLHGFWGALFAATLFESAKLTFAYYLSNYNTYQLLYGAFAAVPIFFVWIYWVWIITLVGAEISYALSAHHQRRLGKHLDGFSHALAWLYHLRIAQLAGGGLTIDELIDTCEKPYLIDIGEMIKLLVRLHFIQITSDGLYVLSRDLGKVSLYDMTQMLPYPIPSFSRLTQSDKLTQKWHSQLKQANKDLQIALDVSLEKLFES